MRIRKLRASGLARVFLPALPLVAAPIPVTDPNGLVFVWKNEKAASREWKLFAGIGHTWQELDATEQTMESDSDDNYLMLGLSKKLNDNYI